MKLTVTTAPEPPKPVQKTVDIPKWGYNREAEAKPPKPPKD